MLSVKKAGLERPGRSLVSVLAAFVPTHSHIALRMSDPLKNILKELIVTTLKLEGVSAADLSDDEPLIGSGLNLDSIDALELVVTLEKRFGIKISSSEESRQALASIAHLAEFIRARADPARLPA
ncbi:MAG: acyl carrier protein [Verrucomicrobia bacterium]|nr:acyl carrier protein [Verrucomicrobiota bacterium]